MATKSQTTHTADTANGAANGASANGATVVSQTQTDAAASETTVSQTQPHTDTAPSSAFDMDALLGATVIPDMDAVTAAWSAPTTRTAKGTVDIRTTVAYQIVDGFSRDRTLPNGSTYKVGSIVQIPWTALASLPSMQPSEANAKRGKGDRPHERTYKALALAAAALTPPMYVQPLTDTERQKAADHLRPDTCAFTLIPLTEREAATQARIGKRAEKRAERMRARLVAYFTEAIAAVKAAYARAEAHAANASA